ncbi:hypothetical protein [Pseudomonas sp. Irchel 3E13]|uniref:hypothetical protein n=1 Tax=Pseudomonas sp. Irchel 3E13 TaxID=2008975 RepID=UPI000BA3405F|nr:hypothetical protein [Pseudomonas sp. Irchel 3E13]
MVSKDEKARLILNILEADWPTAVDIVPKALELAGLESTTPECVELLRRCLASYQSYLGESDRARLISFLDPFLSGLTTILLKEPTPTDTVLEIKGLLDGVVKSECHSDARLRIEQILMPEGSSIGRVWQAIKED